MQPRTDNGFTLVELIIVIVIIVIIASFAFPVFIGVQERGYITKDMNNLRQLAFATQRYLNDNDGQLFPTTGATWMNRLCPGIASTSQYISDWAVFQSPFDTRTRTQALAQTPVSYGINNYSGTLVPDGLDTSKIINPTAFILFAPAQSSNTTISFAGTAASVGGVKVVGLGQGPPPSAQSNPPGGTINFGIQQQRQRISAVCFDGHAENMTWGMFCAITSTLTDANADCRWSYNCKLTAAKPAPH
jgi:prepilin-type N-terminal cleavage/methylation domain-containing protein